VKQPLKAEAAVRDRVPDNVHTKMQRRSPVGAEVQAGGGTDFRVWAPRCESLKLELCHDSHDGAEELLMRRGKEGYFELFVPRVKAGMLYRYSTTSGAHPDPASRFQPEGPNGPSQVVDPGAFRWTDQRWPGVAHQSPVIYEMHIGTFTPQGTWDAAAEQLPELANLGITLLELMPVADFPGRFGWGYDGVNLFAPTRLYGEPDDFRKFVNRAHEVGLGVILDVVYNHFGPDGNYLKEFSEDYFTDKYENEWGQPINFDGENSGPVREFFISNAAYWIEEFHLDGLRLDATQQIFDGSADNIQAAISRAVRQAAGTRRTYIVAENEPQHTRLVRSPESGGYGMDALWNDDFHHSATVALTGRREAYYTDYRGSPQEFISAAKRGYLYQGQWYAWQKKRRGTRSSGLHPAQFVNYLQNHDQIANSLRGLRAHQLAAGGCVRALTALLLLGPGTPMLFQGQEFGSSAPFVYFADHKPELGKLVAQGRREFLRQFPTISCPESDPYLCEPGSEAAFNSSKLDFSEREKHRATYDLHRDLLKLRREDPVFSAPAPGGVDGAVLGAEAFVLRLCNGEEERLLLVNLGADELLSPAPEPLLAPPQNCDWQVVWSSESPRYGGCGTPPFDSGAEWRLLGRSAIVLKPAPV
jgi:maltooligosyltrehalose trehalohydrolase